MTFLFVCGNELEVVTRVCGVSQSRLCSVFAGTQISHQSASVIEVPHLDNLKLLFQAKHW